MSDAFAIDDDCLWTLEPHLCRFCMGRIVSSGERFQCACCGVDARGVTDGKPTAICGCGIRVGQGKLRDRQLFRCAPNPARSETARAELAIIFGDPTGPSASAPNCRPAAQVAA